MSVMENDKLFTKNIIEAVIKLAVLGVLIIWAFQLIRPFITPVIWGIILAVAVEPMIAKLSEKLGGKRSLAATLFVLAIVAALIIPTVLLLISSFDAVQALKAQDKDTTEIQERFDKVWAQADVTLTASRF